MKEQFSRTELLIGKDNVQKLNNSKVAIFGIGGVGSFVAEALARAGIGSFLLIDNDVVSESNINRQLVALHSTVGQLKIDVMKNRILDINPNATVETKAIFYLPETQTQIELSDCNYIVDAIDTVTAKILLIENAKKLSVPIISAMGAGNKLDATKFEITDIYKTKCCPLAKVLRHELKSRGITDLKVVYSTEQPSYTGRPPASISFVPSVAGLLLAGEVVKDLIK